EEKRLDNLRQYHKNKTCVIPNDGFATGRSADLTQGDGLRNGAGVWPPSNAGSLTSFGMTTRSHIGLVRPNCALNRVGDAVGLLVDLVEFPPLDQKTNLRLGAGIAQKYPAFAGEFALDLVS
ncbi:MAG: hypothetical protein QOI96_1765, partial [Verrucomicrobiota bacterium]